MSSLSRKSSVAEIRSRFDQDVERFSNLATGQQVAVDAPLMMDLLARAAQRCTPSARTLLDVGCGAGNLTLKILEQLPDLDCTLVDLSQPMLNRAHERVSACTLGEVRTIQSDIRSAELKPNRYDVIVAASVLHHLRDDEDWEQVFQRLFEALAPGGSLWISDLVSHECAGIEADMRTRYGEFLEIRGGVTYRDQVFAYIDAEDSPRSVSYQCQLLHELGFSTVEVLHKHLCFAVFGGTKAA